MKKNKMIFLCNITNFILGLLVIGMAIVFFLNIRRHSFLIPGILCLGGMMNLLKAAKGDDKLQRLSTITYWMIGLVLQGGAIISMIEIWRS